VCLWGKLDNRVVECSSNDRDCAGMGGTNSRGRAFAAMNEEQPLTPTTPRREIAQPWSLPPDSPTDSHTEDRPEDQTCSSVFDGE